MTRLLAAVSVAAVLLPGVAFAAADPPDCARQLRTIYRYEAMVDRANELGNDVWAERTQAHVDLLEDRLASRCPNYTSRDEEQEAARQMAIILKAAAMAAVKFVTFGAY